MTGSKIDSSWNTADELRIASKADFISESQVCKIAFGEELATYQLKTPE